MRWKPARRQHMPACATPALEVNPMSDFTGKAPEKKTSGVNGFADTYRWFSLKKYGENAEQGLTAATAFVLRGRIDFPACFRPGRIFCRAVFNLYNILASLCGIWAADLCNRMGKNLGI